LRKIGFSEFVYYRVGSRQEAAHSQHMLPLAKRVPRDRQTCRLTTSQPITVMRPRYCPDARLRAVSRRGEAVPKHYDRRAATDSLDQLPPCGSDSFSWGISWVRQQFVCTLCARYPIRRTNGEVDVLVVWAGTQSARIARLIGRPNKSAADHQSAAHRARRSGIVDRKFETTLET
jgi:hypothetical protein